MRSHPAPPAPLQGRPRPRAAVVPRAGRGAAGGRRCGEDSAAAGLGSPLPLPPRAALGHRTGGAGGLLPSPQPADLKTASPGLHFPSNSQSLKAGKAGRGVSNTCGGNQVPKGAGIRDPQLEEGWRIGAAAAGAFPQSGASFRLGPRASCLLGSSLQRQKFLFV